MEKKDTISSPTVIADMIIKKIVNFATTVEGPTTQELKENCELKNIDNSDDSMFAFPTNMTEVLNTVGKLKNNRAVGIDGVSAEVIKTSLPVIIFYFN